jgi:hypothetical protein
MSWLLMTDAVSDHPRNHPASTRDGGGHWEQVGVIVTWCLVTPLVSLVKPDLLGR